jgi:hypothetical protein
MTEHLYAIKWTFLDWWRYGYRVDMANYTMNREVYRYTYWRREL